MPHLAVLALNDVLESRRRKRRFGAGLRRQPFIRSADGTAHRVMGIAGGFLVMALGAALGADVTNARSCVQIRRDKSAGKILLCYGTVAVPDIDPPGQSRDAGQQCKQAKQSPAVEQGGP